MSSNGDPAAIHLTHTDANGEARMVDVGAKSATERFARAAGAIAMKAATLAAIRADEVGKGDVLGVARIAGIMGAKRTSDLIPLCHPIALTHVDVVLRTDDSLPGVIVEASASCVGATGVEMEAITAVIVALITIYDMAKGVDRDMVIGDVRLLEKRGGKSGRFVRETPPPVDSGIRSGS